MRNVFFIVALFVFSFFLSAPAALAGQACIGYTSLTVNGDFSNWHATPLLDPFFLSAPLQPDNWIYWATSAVGSDANLQRTTTAYSAPYAPNLSTDNGNFNLLSQGVSSTPTQIYAYTYFGTSFQPNNISCSVVSDQPDASILFTGGDPADFKFWDFVHGSWTDAATTNIGQYGVRCDFNLNDTWKEITGSIVTGSPTTNTFFWLIAQDDFASQYYDDFSFGTCTEVVTTTEIMLTNTTTAAIATLNDNSQIIVIILLVVVVILGIDLLRRMISFGQKNHR